MVYPVNMQLYPGAEQTLLATAMLGRMSSTFMSGNPFPSPQPFFAAPDGLGPDHSWQLPQANVMGGNPLAMLFALMMMRQPDGGGGSRNGFEVTPEGYRPFSLHLGKAERLLDSADGMVAYNRQDWKNFPKRTADEWGTAFNSRFEFTAGSQEGDADGSLSYREADLASHQLAYDRNNGQSADSGVNANPISGDQAQLGQNLMDSIYDARGRLRKELDLDHDGRFTKKDLIGLAALSGRDDVLSSDDFIAAKKLYDRRLPDQTNA